MAAVVQERTVPPADTLIKYDNPVLVTTHLEKVGSEEQPPD